MLQVVLHEPCRVEGEPHDSVRSHVSRLLHRARTLMCARLSHLHLDWAHPVPHLHQDWAQQALSGAEPQRQAQRTHAQN